MASRLKNPPAENPSTPARREERKWELLTKAEVETRLGYPVTELPRDDKLGRPRRGQGQAVGLHPGHDSIHDLVGRLPLRRFRHHRGTDRQGQHARQERGQANRVRRSAWHEVAASDIVLWEAAVDTQTGEVGETFAARTAVSTGRKSDLREVQQFQSVKAIEYIGLRSPRRWHRSSRTVSGATTASRARALAEINEQRNPAWFPTDAHSTRTARNTAGMRCQPEASRRSQISIHATKSAGALAAVGSEPSAAQDAGYVGLALFAFTAICHPIERLNRLRPSEGGWQLAHRLTLHLLTHARRQRAASVRGRSIQKSRFSCCSATWPRIIAVLRAKWLRVHSLHSRRIS